MKIIVRVRELRKHHNLTQEELAKQLNISRQSLISLEQGRWLPSLPLAIQLAEFFNTPLEQVISPSEQPKQERKESQMPREIGPWSPFRELRDMREEMDRMFDQSVRYPFGTATVFPTINVREDDKHFYLEAHVPGFTDDNIDIDIADDMVTISGSTNEENKEEKDATGYLRREYRIQSFTRTLTLPTPVISDEANAELKHGILTVTLPKVLEERPKTKRLKPKSA